MTTTTNSRLPRRGLLLEYLTLGWNVAGAVICLDSAIAARSVALAGFGLDSLIEIGASTIVVWHLRGVQSGRREQRALRGIAVAFFALALYILTQSVGALRLGARPGVSALGLAWLAVTLPVMLALAAGKHVTGKALDNPVLLTEARVTLIDAFLAAAVLAGIALNARFGWWWADPAAGLIIVFYGFKEGCHAWTESRVVYARLRND